MKKILLVGISTVLLGVMAGCSQTEVKKPVTETTQTSINGESQTKSSANQKSISEVKIITLEEARDIYEKAHPKTDITSIQLDSTRGDFFYKIDGMDDSNDYEMKFNAVTKDIKKDKTEKLDKEDIGQNKDKKIDLSGLKTIDEVTEIAEKEATVGKAEEWTLEKELGVTFWEVEVRDGHKETQVKIDAKTGKVLETRQDD